MALRRHAGPVRAQRSALCIVRWDAAGLHGPAPPRRKRARRRGTAREARDTGRRNLRVVCFLMRRREGHAPRRLSARGSLSRHSANRAPRWFFLREEQSTNALARYSLAPPGRVARAAGGARGGRGKFKKPLRRDLFASHAASARFFACPQPQRHLRAGGVSTRKLEGARAYLTLWRMMTCESSRWRTSPSRARRTIRSQSRRCPASSDENVSG